MDYKIKNAVRTGTVSVPSSKSYAHRQLICAALSGTKSVLTCNGMSEDIKATISCLNSLGADINMQGDKITVIPVREVSGVRELECNESGSTLRFLLPITGALGRSAVFNMKGKLAHRPMKELNRVLTEHGMDIRQDGDKLFCSGCLEGGNYVIPGDISSQYVSGLLMALCILDEDSTLTVTGNISSEDYIKMTEDVLLNAGAGIEHIDNVYYIKGRKRLASPELSTVESDWSNAAFYCCMGALSEKGIILRGMNIDSAQGDKAILSILGSIGADIDIGRDEIRIRKKYIHPVTIDADAIPDLIPAISVVLAVADGISKIVNAQRLRAKESDRIKSVADMIRALGGEITELPDGLVIYGTGRTGKTCTVGHLNGGRVNSYNDHRIAMSAAVAGLVCHDEIEVIDAQCVAKSYPGFWEDYEKLEML